MSILANNKFIAGIESEGSARNSMTAHSYHCLLCLIFAVLALSLIPNCATAKRMHNKHYRFRITIPDDMIEIKCAPDSVRGELYYGTLPWMTLAISARESRFKSVSDYVDCNKAELEQILRNAYGDSSFHLINCSKSLYYPSKITALYFQARSQALGNDMNLIYFIHHRRKDIQLYFTFRKEIESTALIYINTVMQSLRLK